MVIPLPNINPAYISSSEFILDNNTVVKAQNDSIKQAEYLVDKLDELCDIKIKIYPENSDNEPLNDKTSIISLEVSSSASSLGKEGYRLTIRGDTIEILGSTAAGLFYGIQTLIQLVIEAKNESTVISLIPKQIQDFPRFRWRGFMLDEARHFQGKEIVKELIKIMGMLKLNKFHWHLSDDQGWRIELDKFPELINTGSLREETQVGGFISYLTGWKDRSGHSGYYTKADIREIIAFANDHGIEVIPEIDMPGHTSALIASYPQLSCREEEITVPGTFGIKKDVLCAGKESVYSVLEDILSEIVDLFPSKYFHIGGDETPKSRWKQCYSCQKKMYSENLEDEEGLQAYFMNRVGSFLMNQGKKVIFWNDSLHKDLNDDFIGQYWLFKHNQVIKEMERGRKFIISRFFHTYLDYNYYLTPLEKVYNFDPVPRELDKSQLSSIIGIEAPLWTEWVRNRSRLYWQVLPRLIAIAEIGWTSRNRKDYDDFIQRLEIMLDLLRNEDIPFAEVGTSNPSRLQRVLHLLSHFTEPKLRFGN